MDFFFAYLDPGSGSVLLQALLGGAAAVAVGAKLWMSRVRNLFRPRRSEQQVDETPTG